MSETEMMQGYPPPPEKRVDLETWDRWPALRWSFRNVRSVLPTRAVAAGTAIALPRAEQRLEELALPVMDRRADTLGGLLAETETDACLVLHRGRVVFERYYDGMGERDLHLSQSVSKSFVGTLVGLAAARGLIDLNKPMEHYVPELAGCGYRGATIGQVLDMRSGVGFVEDYLDPDSHMGALERASAWKPRRPGETFDTYDLILTLEQARPHGGSFLYRSIETDTLGWLLERVSGQSLALLLSEWIWQPMGAEAEGCFSVDRAGSCLADGGLNASLRDYGRFGLLFANEGAIGGRQVVPAAWVSACRDGDPAAFAEAPNVAMRDLPNACYSRQWWVLDREAGISAALGIHGQMIYVDPRRETVVVLLSSWPDALDAGKRRAFFRASETIARALGEAGS